MKPPVFEYRVAESLDHALQLKADAGPDALLLSGGQSLIPMLNMRLARPELLIDLNCVEELDFVERRDGHIVVGAMTRQRTLERSPIALEHCPLLRETLENVAHPVIRNRGTVGGSIAHAASPAELPATVVALGGSVTVAGPNGRRTIPAHDFFLFQFVTAIEPDEVVVSVNFPVLGDGVGWAFTEFARRHGDFALAGVAAVAHEDGIRLAFAGVAGRPVLVESDDPAEASAAVDPVSDVHASADYRRKLVGVLARRATDTARSRRGQGTKSRHRTTPSRSHCASTGARSNGRSSLACC
jgi:carbon-monoxide dehydrogenase medium subunit